mgnify:FL=1
MFGSGGAPIFSIKRGMKENVKAGIIMNTSFSMVCVGGMILMAVGIIFAKPILYLFGASDNAITYAYPYMIIYLIGTIPSMISTGMNPFINAQGYATTGMISVAIGAIANIVLDPIFIFALNMGIEGAAIATVVSQFMSAVFVLYILRKKTEYKVRFIRKTELKSAFILQKIL